MKLAKTSFSIEKKWWTSFWKFQRGCRPRRICGSSSRAYRCESIHRDSNSRCIRHSVILLSRECSSPFSWSTSRTLARTCILSILTRRVSSVSHVEHILSRSRWAKTTSCNRSPLSWCRSKTTEQRVKARKFRNRWSRLAGQDQNNSKRTQLIKSTSRWRWARPNVQTTRSRVWKQNKWKEFAKSKVTWWYSNHMLIWSKETVR